MTGHDGHEGLPGRRWWLVWTLASAAWVWVVGLLGGLIASGGLNAGGPSFAQRIFGSSLVGVAFGAPVLALLAHQLMRRRARHISLVACAAALLSAFVTFRYWS